MLQNTKKILLKGLHSVAFAPIIMYVTVNEEE